MCSRRGAITILLGSAILCATGCCLEITGVAETSPSSTGSSSGGHRANTAGGTTIGASSSAASSSTSAAATGTGTTGGFGTTTAGGGSSGSTTGIPQDGCTISGQFYPALSLNLNNLAQCCNPEINAGAWIPLFVKAISVPVDHEDSSMTGFAGTNDGLVADLNGDGIADVVATVYVRTNGTLGQSQAWVWLSSDGGFEGPSTYPATHPNESWPGSVAVGDFNKDGVPDLVVSSSNSLEIRLGTGNGQFGAEQYISSPMLAGCSAGFGYARAIDANSDGWPDVVESSQNCGLLLFLNDAQGDGALTDPMEVAGSVSAAPICAGDFNGDGFADLAVVNSNSMGWFVNSVSGLNYSPLELSPSGASNMVSFSGSGGDGLAVASGNTVLVFLPNSAGPQGPTSYSLDVGGAYISAGDLNGDGLPDLVVVGGETIYVLINLGNGQFSQAASMQATAASQYGIQRMGVGDLNGDGVADVVLFWGYGPWEGWINTCGPGAAATLAADGVHP